PALLGGIYLVRAASFVLLFYVAPDIRLLYVFVVLFGLVDYATVPVTASLAVSHLGIDRIGLAMGLISGGHALGGALGALFGGMLFDGTGGYGWLWFVSLAFSALAALLVFTLQEKPGDAGMRVQPEGATR
ncbi:MFS transporter, partial [Rhizobiaceae sp. 2RAB30]